MSLPQFLALLSMLLFLGSLIVGCRFYEAVLFTIAVMSISFMAYGVALLAFAMLR